MTTNNWAYGLTRKLPARIALGLLVLTGCANDDRGYAVHTEELHPFTGAVFVDGKPANNAVVTFHRADAAASAVVPAKKGENRKPNPRGECDEDGSFEIYTYSAFDGAPPGEYLVTISWKDPQGFNRDDVVYPELLPAKFQKPTQSGLTAKVEEGENEPARFRITTKQVAAAQ